MRSIIIILLLCVAFSCKKELEKPDNLIPREQMKEVVKEMYLYRNLREVTMSNGEEPFDRQDMNARILKRYDISLEEFESSYKYYVIDNAAYDDFLKEIKDEISQSEYVEKEDTLLSPDLK
ncbi:MAG: DUF4296 domain-containing protein [Weeksellaceae bacterium]